jgi:superoxide dismutase, Fe-Mn family
MDLQPHDLPFDPATLPGLSERLLRSHHANNYGGAVRRLNAIRAELQTLAFDAAPGFRLNGLKREELVAANSMLLHELYFDSLGSTAPIAPAMALALEAAFGSVERWRAEFTALGRALGGGSGWVLLAYEAREGRLVNQWASDHTQALAGAWPILALDMYEHAYHLDHGAAAGAYVDAFMANIAWPRVHARYRQAVAQHSAAFGATAAELAGARLLDVRRAGAFEQAPTLIEGAAWQDPAQVAQWAPELAGGQPVVVYCVHGQEVSQATALRLRGAGIDARFLRDGIEGWQAGGGPLVPKA